MRDLAESRRLQASDRTAINALVDFTLPRTDADWAPGVDALLRTLLLRYPGDVTLSMARYRLFAADGASDAELLALVEAAREARPARVELHFAAARHRIPADMGAAYQALFEGMQRDPLRRYLTSLRRTFEQ